MHGAKKQWGTAQTEYHSRLQNILKKEGTTLGKILGEIIALEKEIERKAPTEEEAKQLLYASSVARHSAEYWHQNIATWFALLNSEIVDILPADEAIGNAALQGLMASYSGGTPVRDGAYPFPGNPHLFIYVSDGIATVMECPEGMHFNQEMCHCDWPQNTFWQDAADEARRITSVDVAGAVGATLFGLPGVLGAGLIASGGYALGELLINLRWW